MSTEITFYYDFASPNSYLANQVIHKIAERTGNSVRHVPCLLGGIFREVGNQPPWMAAADCKPKLDYMQAEIQRYVRRFGLHKFKMSPHFPMNTLPLMRAAVAAEMDCQVSQFIEAGERLIWEDGENIQEQDVFIAGFTAAGFDGASMWERTQDAAVKQQLIDNTQQAVDRGVFGLPTFFVGDEMFFGKDSLYDLEAELNGLEGL